MRVIAHCPKCGGTDIREKNEAYAEVTVTAWEIEAGVLVPTAWCWDVDAEWYSSDDPFPYVCHSYGADGRCDWEGDVDQLVIEHEEDEDDAL